MGYKPIGKYKTIVLPIPNYIESEAITIKQYKEKYGIDLKSFIFVDESNCIGFNMPFGTMLLLDSKEIADTLPTTHLGLMPVGSFAQESYWDEGVDPARTYLTYSDLLKLVFKISEDDELNIDNVKIYYDEI